MKARLKTLLQPLLATALGLGLPAVQAAEITLVNTGTSYNYTVIPDLWGSGGGNWGSVGLATFDNFVAVNPVSGWSTGNSGFGNAPIGSTPVGTPWAADTDLALLTTFNYAGGIGGPLTLNVAADNGFVIFLNDVQLAKENAEGFTSYWEYTFSVSSSLLLNGANTIKVLAEDHGGLTHFDMKLAGQAPAPASLALLGVALLGVAAARRLRA